MGSYKPIDSMRDDYGQGRQSDAKSGMAMNVRDRHLLGAFAVVGVLVLSVAAAPAPAFNYVHTSQFGAPGDQAGDLSEPQGLAVDQSTQDVYVADAGNHRVHKFDASGDFIAAWGWGVADGTEQSEVCTAKCQAG